MDSAKQIFTQLDGDGDGKVTQDEMATSISKLAESLDNQFNQSRVQGGMPPPPPPPPSGGNDESLTKDELSSKLSETSSSDSAQSALMTKVFENFEAADTNQDGEVSLQEAMAYDQANPSSTSTSTDTSTTSVASSDKTDAQVFRQIMELLHSYGNAEQSGQNALSSLVSTAV